MSRLIRMFAILALMFAPLTPAAARAPATMADCHHAAPAKPDCCGDTGGHICCPAALAVLPEAARPVPAAFAFARWPDFAVRVAATAPLPIDQPPRA